MAMPRFLRIKNFEKYQTFTKQNPPWFKVHKTMFGDREFMKLSTHHRFLYIGLIHLAVETNNSIYNDPTWIGQRLYIPPTEIDLKPLFRSGFLLTSNLSRTLSETETETETETEAETEREGEENVAGEPAPPPPPPVPKKQKRILTGWPEGFMYNEKHQALAEALGLNVALEFAQFRDKSLAKGYTYLDWDAAFRNWLRQAAEFRKARTA